MEKVKALIIGAGRSGTTSLYHYLNDHQEICFSSIKEIHYFSVNDLYKRGESYFQSFFINDNNKIRVSADTYLLPDKKAPERIRSYNPEIKIILILRDPVERAYSSYQYSINNGYENRSISFLKSLELEKERLATDDIARLNNLCHFYGSLYYQHISHWQHFFPKENFLILTTSDLKNNPQKLLKNLSAFLNISPFTYKEAKENNKASGSKSKSLQQFLLDRNHPLRKLTRPIVKPLKSIIIKTGLVDFLYKLNKKENSFPPLSEEDRKALEPYFAGDLQNLKKEFGTSF
jgi:hypothetical protein